MTSKHEPHSAPALGWLILILLGVLALWVACGWLLYNDSQRGTFGDMFGAMNALLSGLAFAALIYTVWMQRREVALQRMELQLIFPICAIRDPFDLNGSATHYLSASLMRLLLAENKVSWQKWGRSIFD